MKIIHTIAAYPPHAGGMEHNTKYNATEMAKRGYEVVVYTSSKGYKPEVKRESKNLEVDYLPSFEIAHTQIMPSLLPKLLRLSKDSVVHMHVAQAFVPEITYLACKFRGIPYLAHIHLDVDPTGVMGFVLPFYKKFILGPILRSADAVTVLTPDYVDLIAKNYKVSKKKIVLIPNGTYFTPGKKIKEKVHKPLRLFFVGRLSKQKNIPLLLNSVALIINKYKIPAILKIAGDGEEKKEVIKLISNLKIKKYVSLLGTVTPKDVQKWQRWADISLVTSRSEAFGTVVTEAMASGTPVVSTNIFSVRNIVNNGYNGFLVKDDPNEMALVIKKLVDNTKIYKSVIKNGLKSSNQYRWSTVVDKYEDLYLKLSRRIKE